MTDLAAKFTTLETQLATQQTALLAVLGDVNTTLGLINTNLGNLGASGVTNTNLLLAAIGANNPCAACPTPTIIPPALSTVAPGIDADRCKRAQAFIRFVRSYLTVQNAASTFGMSFNPTFLTDAVGQALTNIGSTDAVPVISFAEAFNLAGDMITYTVDNFTRADRLDTQFDTIKGLLVAAVYSGGDTTTSKAQYDATIDASSLPADEKAVMKDDGYIAAINWFLDPANSPDLTGIDGTACGGDLAESTTCVTLNSFLYHDTDGFDRYHVATAPSYMGDASLTAGDFNGWSVTVTVNEPGATIEVGAYTAPGVGSILGGIDTETGPLVIGEHTVALLIFTDHTGSGTTPFTVVICPPGLEPS